MAEKSDVILRFNDSKKFVVLVDKSCKKEYSKYLSSQGAARLKFIELTNECERLKTELTSANKNVAYLDRKLWEAKQSLDDEKQLRRKAEVERDVFIRQIVADRTFEGEFSNFVTNKEKSKQWANECCHQLKVALRTANENIEFLRNELSAARSSVDVEEQSSSRKAGSYTHYIEEFCFVNNLENDDSSSVIIPDDGEFSAVNDAEILPDNDGEFCAANDAEILPDDDGEFCAANEVEILPDDDGEFCAANDVEILPDDDGEFCAANDAEILPDEEFDFSTANDVEVIPNEESEFSARNNVESVIYTIPLSNARDENVLFPLSSGENSPNITTSFPEQEEIVTVQCTSNNETELCEETVDLEDSIRPAVSLPDNAGDLNSFYSCALCKKGYKLKRNLKKHMSTHENEVELISRRTCDVCLKVFKNRTNLKFHMLTHESNPNYSFKCNVCDRGFARQSSLNAHVLTHETDLAVKYRYKCKVCGKGFIRRTDKRRHVRTHTTPVVVKNHYLCSCGKKFKWISVLKKHMLSHNHETGVDFDDTFQCDTCNESFTSKVALKSHLMTHLSKKHRYQCDVCSKVFTRGNHLKVHKLNHETDPNLKYIHRCTICDKGFTTNSHFKRHQLTHETNPDLRYLFKCSICMKGFSRKDNLKTHFLTHENNMINFKHILEFDPADGPNVPVK